MAQITSLRITDYQMLMVLIQKHDELGRWPRYPEISEDPDMESPSRYAARFGTMVAAREAALLVAGRLTEGQMQEILLRRKTLLAKLQALCERNDGKVSRSLISKTSGMPPLTEYSRCCGGLDEALKMLGLPVTIPDQNDLIVAIRRFYRENGYVPTVADCHDGECGYAMSAFRGGFGSWNNTIIAAGFRPNLDQPNRRETLRKRQALKDSAIEAA